MKILLVNDDGFYSEGLQTLDRVLSENGHEVWVCAPESQRSACSHAISLHNPVKIKKVSEKHYICEGFPADCVLFSVLGAIPMGKPDMVISGINHGFNISTDLIYSATVAGANEGAIRGIPSIAISCENVVESGQQAGEKPDSRDFESFPFEDAANFLAEHIEEFYNSFEIGSFININVPNNAHGIWQTTTIGSIEFYDVVENDNQKDYYRLKGAAFPDCISKELEKTDYYTVFIKKKISVSALKVKLRYNDAMQTKLSSLA